MGQLVLLSGLLDEVLPRSHLGLHRVMTGIWGDASFYSQSLYVDIPFGINTVLQVNELYYALAVEIQLLGRGFRETYLLFVMHIHQREMIG